MNLNISPIFLAQTACPACSDLPAFTSKLSQHVCHFSLDQTNATSDDWTKVVTILVSLINLGIVLYIFRTSLIDRRKEARLKSVSFWIQDLILKPNTDFINTYFNEIESSLSAFSAEMKQLKNAGNTPITDLQTKIQNFLDKIDEKGRQFRYKIIHPLMAVDGFSAFNIGSEFDKLIDQVSIYATEYYDITPASPNPNAPDVLGLRVKFLSSLNKAHINSCALDS